MMVVDRGPFVIRTYAITPTSRLSIVPAAVAATPLPPLEAELEFDERDEE